MANQSYFEFKRDLASRRKAIRYSQPNFRWLADCVELGCQDYTEATENNIKLMRVSPAAHAFNVNDLIWARVLDTIRGAGASLASELSFKCLELSKKYYLRIKKGDSDLLYSNYLTETQEDVVDQDFSNRLIHAPRLPILHCVYWFDAATFKARGLWLTCQKNRQHLWQPFDILKWVADADDAGSEKLVQPKPKPPTPVIKLRKDA